MNGEELQQITGNARNAWLNRELNQGSVCGKYDLGNLTSIKVQKRNVSVVTSHVCSWSLHSLAEDTNTFR